VLLKYLHESVFLLDTKATTCTEQLTDVTENDLLIAISSRGYAKPSGKMAEFYAELGARVIVLVDE